MNLNMNYFTVGLLIIGIVIVGFAIIATKGKPQKEIGNSVNNDIEVFNETKDMDWQSACLIINNRSRDLAEREALKERILALRKIKGID